MVKSSDPRQSHDAPAARQFNGARDRRVAAERHVRSVLVVVGGVQSNETQQVSLAEHDHVVEDLAPEGADKSLGITVLPRRPWGNLDLVMPRRFTRALNAAP
jgi:hypothetical protein